MRLDGTLQLPIFIGILLGPDIPDHIPYQDCSLLDLSLSLSLKHVYLDVHGTVVLFHHTALWSWVF